MISSRFHHFLDRPLSPLARALRFIPPNAVTVLGFLLTAASGLLIPYGPRRAGLLVLAAGFFDLLDGVMARTNGQESAFGAFLDSLLDRYADACLFLGAAALFLKEGDLSGAWLSAGTLIGAYGVSYAKARAEGLGISCHVGLMERGERIVLLVFGLLTGWLLPMMAVLFVLTHLTAFQRIGRVWSASRSG